MLGRAMTFRIRSARNAFDLGSYSLSALALNLHSLRRRARGGLVDLPDTDSAANQFGAHVTERVKTPRGTFPLFLASVRPSRICRISEQERDYDER
jgi:hypothetical protein